MKINELIKQLQSLEEKYGIETRVCIYGYYPEGCNSYDCDNTDITEIEHILIEEKGNESIISINYEETPYWYKD